MTGCSIPASRRLRSRVADDDQGRPIGMRMLEQLAAIAAGRGIHRFDASAQLQAHALDLPSSADATKDPAPPAPHGARPRSGARRGSSSSTRRPRAAPRRALGASCDVAPAISGHARADRRHTTLHDPPARRHPGRGADQLRSPRASAPGYPAPRNRPPSVTADRGRARRRPARQESCGASSAGCEPDGTRLSECSHGGSRLPPYSCGRARSV